MRVLVTGGTGLLGGAVTDRLIGVGHDLTVLSRAAAEPHSPDFAVGDLRTGDGLNEAVAGVDVIFTVHQIP